MHLRNPSCAIQTALIAAMLLLIGTGAAGARDRGDDRREALRRAVEAGEIRPLADILNALRARLVGDITGIEIEREDGRWRYELRLIDGRGRLLEVYVDARTGEIERTREK
jgi:uncharacterized membrane protein YkoI